MGSQESDMTEVTQHTHTHTHTHTHILLSVAWLEGTLVAPMYRDTDSLHHRSYGSIRVFF